MCAKTMLIKTIIVKKRVRMRMRKRKRKRKKKRMKLRSVFASPISPIRY